MTFKTINDDLCKNDERDKYDIDFIGASRTTKFHKLD
jgi:hypothetical protein